MIILLETEELIPLLQAIDAQERDSRDIPRGDFDKETYRIASRVINVAMGYDNDVEGLDDAFGIANDSGFDRYIPTLWECLNRLMAAMFPNGAIISVEVMNRHGTIAININPRVKTDGRNYPFLQQYR